MLAEGKRLGDKVEQKKQMDDESVPAERPLRLQLQGTLCFFLRAWCTSTVQRPLHLIVGGSCLVFFMCVASCDLLYNHYHGK
jgi:hypothetical protein